MYSALLQFSEPPRLHADFYDFGWAIVLQCFKCILNVDDESSSAGIHLFYSAVSHPECYFLGFSIDDH